MELIDEMKKAANDLGFSLTATSGRDSVLITILIAKGIITVEEAREIEREIKDL